MDLSMQMKALRSENFAKLSSSSSTRDEYWVTSISAGTPAGYCLSQMRSLLFPLFVRCLEHRPFVGARSGVLGSIEHCGGRWQAPARLGRTGTAPVRAAETAGASALSDSEPGLQL